MVFYYNIRGSLTRKRSEGSGGGMTILGLPDVRQLLGARDPRELNAENRWASVAMMLRDTKAGPEVLFIRRAEHPDDPWSGHMAFPGGRKEEHDLSLLHTAQRETLEEVGIDLQRHAEPIGQLDDLQAVARGKPAGTVIRPYVFEVYSDVPLRIDRTEVAEAIWTPISPLFHGEADTVRPYAWQDRTIEFPAYDVRGRVVWGLTYQMLRSFFRIVDTQL
jgi:8-oxo-dGTP pyrophosphatase MutT (NUDIX family)